MRKLIVSAFIGSYLLVLGFGLASHLLGYRTYDSLAMYFIVWDMYCGWDAYETRRIIVAEGESGAHYELTPQPWGSFVPYGSAARHDLDYFGYFSGRVAANVLRQTEHEPISRIYLIDSVWPKKYNIPESTWQARYSEPRARVPYFYLRAAYSPAGELESLEPDWKNFLTGRALQDNPRLQAEVRAAQPFIATSLSGSGPRAAREEFDPTPEAP
jgi:hypothetical protein